MLESTGAHPCAAGDGGFQKAAESGGVMDILGEDCRFFLEDFN